MPPFRIGRFYSPRLPGLKSNLKINHYWLFVISVVVRVTPCLLTSELLLFVIREREMFVGGSGGEAVLQTLIFTIHPRDCHSASPPGAFLAAPPGRRASPTPVPATSSRDHPSRTPPRRGREKMSQQKLLSPCP